MNDATRELRQTNTELVESYHRVLTLREALARAERMAALGQMAANVAHQIGTPLNLISGYVQLVMRKPTRIRARCDRLADRRATDPTGDRLGLRSMLDYARQPAAARERQRGRAGRSGVRDFPPRVARGQRRASAWKRPDPAVHLSGSTQLELALLNLMKQQPGRDAVRRPSRHRRCPRGPDGVRLAVADSGSGIPAAVLARVFEPWVTRRRPGRARGSGSASRVT